MADLFDDRQPPQYERKDVAVGILPPPPNPQENCQVLLRIIRGSFGAYLLDIYSAITAFAVMGLAIGYLTTQHQSTAAELLALTYALDLCSLIWLSGLVRDRFILKSIKIGDHIVPAFAKRNHDGKSLRTRQITATIFFILSWGGFVLVMVQNLETFQYLVVTVSQLYTYLVGFYVIKGVNDRNMSESLGEDLGVKEEPEGCCGKLACCGGGRWPRD